MFSDHFGRWLVFAKSFKRPCPHHAIAGPSSEFDLGDDFRLQPVDARLMARRVLTHEWILVYREFLQPWENSPHDLCAKARANASNINKLIIAIDSGEQRAEAAAFAGPPAKHDFLPGAALGLGPTTLARTVDIAELLGDDTFKRHLASS